MHFVTTDSFYKNTTEENINRTTIIVCMSRNRMFSTPLDVST